MLEIWEWKKILKAKLKKQNVNLVETDVIHNSKTRKKSNMLEIYEANTILNIVAHTAQKYEDDHGSWAV